MLSAKKKLILASSSPRRASLLADMGLEFEVRSVNFEESFPDTIPPEEVPEFISNKKAKQLTQIKASEVHLTSDTTVILENQVIGKPKDQQHAAQLLKLLSGKTHVVITGVTLTATDFTHSFSEKTSVSFFELDDEEIDFYVKNYLPLDKAGAYGIQDWIGHIGVKEINGNFDNVIGLPCSRLFQEMKRLNLFK